MITAQQGEAWGQLHAASPPGALSWRTGDQEKVRRVCARAGHVGCTQKPRAGGRRRRGRTGGPPGGCVTGQSEIQAVRDGDRQAGRLDGQCAPAAFVLVRSPVQKTFLIIALMRYKSHTIQHAHVNHSVVLSIFKGVQPPPQSILKHFVPSDTTKKKPRALKLSPSNPSIPPAPGNHESTFSLFRFACSGFFI